MTAYRLANLANVHPDLVRLVSDVGSSHDIIVIQGARTVAEEQTAMASHHSELKDPMSSKHVIDPEKRPLALAVDIGPWPLDWNDIPSFEGLAAVVKARATVLGVPITWGGDWVTLKDYDHFELKETT